MLVYWMSCVTPSTDLIGVAMPPLEGARQLRFLIADDSDDIRDVFCNFVGRAGHSILPVNDGLEAIEMLQRESFDVMLLDLNMPRMGGVEVLQWLKAHPDVAPGMRVVVVTAHRQQHLSHLAELGVATVIEKPFRLQRVNDLIAETLHDLEEPQAPQLTPCGRRGLVEASSQVRGL